MIQDWFKNAKLGIFIHYGIYAVNSVAESWSFYNGRISYEDYMKQLDGFTAKNFDANKWAELFKKARANYVVLTSKHHDGIALWDTKYSDLNVLAKTPAKRDIIKEYTTAIREHGMKVGIYFSLIDWSNENYKSIYAEGSKPGDPIYENKFSSPIDGIEKPDKWQQFLDFNRNQLTELMTNYGTIDLLWFDGDWERSANQWKMPEFREFLHNLNPNVVLNSRMQGYGDYKTPEQGIPVFQPKGAWEFCTTINDSWGYQKFDNNYKSSLQIIRMFCDCITMGGNLLLDVGPMEDGTIDIRQQQVLIDLGNWITKNEEAVFETEKGIPYNFFLGGSTLSKDKKTLYLFVYDNPIENVCLKGICNKITKITILASQKELTYKLKGGAPWNGIPGTVWIDLNQNDANNQITVLKVELESELKLYYGEGEAVTQN